MKSNTTKTHLYGPNWQGIRCGAKTRGGSACLRPGTKRNGKCRLHGGASRGPTTSAGLARLAKLKTTHGKTTASKRTEAKNKAKFARQLSRELRAIENSAISNGILNKNWRAQFGNF